jgi:hypothetical protein
MHRPTVAWRLACLTVTIVAATATTGAVLADPSPDPTTAPSPSSAAQASPAVRDSPAVDPDAIATCQSFEVRPERCYLEGQARLSLRGAVKRSVDVPLEWGVNASSDVVPSIGLHLEAPGVASMVIDLPGVPGVSETPADGDSAGPGEAQVWWSLHGGDGTHLAAYGHACEVRFEADDAGRLAGTITCPQELAGRGRRYRAEITFDAVPLISGPLPTPMPTPSPAPPSVADAPCASVDDAVVASTLGLKRSALLLLGAGPGQCAGFARDKEVVFLSVRDGVTALELSADAPFRGAACTPLPSLALADASSAASCQWPDGRTMVAGNTLRGSVSLVVALTADARSPDELPPGVTALLTSALARLP